MVNVVGEAIVRPVRARRDGIRRREVVGEAPLELLVDEEGVEPEVERLVALGQLLDLLRVLAEDVAESWLRRELDLDVLGEEERGLDGHLVLAVVGAPRQRVHLGLVVLLASPLLDRELNVDL